MKPIARILIRMTYLLLLLLFPLPGQASLSVVAQFDSIDWSRAGNLSNTPQNSEDVAIVADDYGYVHVFWCEDYGGAPFRYTQSPASGNSILYRRWDGVVWSPAVDVLVVPDDGLAKFVAVDVDAENRLHVVWTGQTNFYYSSAPALQANSAHAWSDPVVVATDSARSQWESDIAVDGSGHIHIIYATSGSAPGVYHISSQDGGRSWSLANRLSLPFDRLEVGFARVKLIADSAGRLHAVWQTSQEEGFGQAVYYARSLDGGENWSAPIQFGYRDAGDYEASYPYLVSVSASELHLIYIDNAHTGRYHRISHDGGETWSAPYHIISEMEGVNGYVFPLVDRAGQMHLIVNMRTIEGQVGGIYYSRWLGSSWTSPVRIDLSDQGGNAHFAAGTVRLGNELHVVWSQLDTGEIGHIRGVVPSVSPAQPLLPTPTAEPLVRASTPSATTEIGVNRSTPTSPPAARLETPGASHPASFVSDQPLVFGIGASLLLVVVVLLRLRARG